MKSVRLGKIEQESFIVQLLAPLPPQGSFEETYEYRVVPTLQSGLEALMRAAKQCGIDFDISHCINEVPQGLTANLCDAIVGITFL